MKTNLKREQRFSLFFGQYLVGKHVLLIRLNFRIIKKILIYIAVLCFGCKPSHSDEAKIVKRTNLEIIFNYCDDYQELYFNKIPYKIFKEDSLITSFKDIYFEANYFPNLEKGNYKIEFVSIFNRVESVDFKLNGKKNDTLTLCVDNFDENKETHIPFIDRLKNDESYNLEITEAGCFHHFESDMIISKNNDTYAMTFGKVSRKLTEEEIGMIRSFEIRLMAIKDSGGCTSYEIFKFRFKGKLQEVIHNRCDWAGFQVLRKSLLKLEY